MFIYSNRFNSFLRQPNLSNSWFLLGNEFVLIENSLKKLLSIQGSNGRLKNNLYYYPDKGFNYEFLADSVSGGLFEESNNYIFRLTSLALAKKQRDCIAFFLEKNQTHQLIFVYPEFKTYDKKNSLVKLFDERAVVVRHMKIKANQFSSWTKDRLRNAGITLAKDSLELFCHHTMGNALQVEQNIQKIKLLKSETLRYEQIKGLLEENNLCSIFDFIDSLFKKNLAESLKKLYWLLNNGESPIKIIFLLDKEVRLLINYCLLKQNKNALGVKQDFIFPAKKPIIEQYLKTISMNKLITSSIMIGKLDRASKGLNNNPTYQLLNNVTLLLAQQRA